MGQYTVIACSTLALLDSLPSTCTCSRLLSRGSRGAVGPTGSFGSRSPSRRCNTELQHHICSLSLVILSTPFPLFTHVHCDITCRLLISTPNINLQCQPRV